MKDKITYNNLVKIQKKLDSKKSKDWDDLVESLYVNYLVSIIEGSHDEDELDSIYIDNTDYKNNYNNFYSSIDTGLEDSIPDILSSLDDEISIGG